ncbi:Lacal_2735 family protein [Aequorivita capsosiphonis]|uniref:Lacal_2735 family protein n=1 Tax=Aequorivita capsosiphonis TaxID=487317 RepID=UPI000427EE2F|nr:Lacal_2735 family protein [Aequorivita capsosiphonis]
MMNWFSKKSRIESLKERYTYLMRKSYETSLKDTEKSESLHRQALNLFQEINYLSLEQSDT